MTSNYVFLRWKLLWEAFVANPFERVLKNSPSVKFKLNLSLLSIFFLPSFAKNIVSGNWKRTIFNPFAKNTFQGHLVCSYFKNDCLLIKSFGSFLTKFIKTFLSGFWNGRNIFAEPKMPKCQNVGLNQYFPVTRPTIESRQM